MRSSITINGKDSKATWGVFLAASGMSALMTPAPSKEYVENDSALEHGKRVVTASAYLPKSGSRDVTLEIWLVADGWTDFLAKYASFCAELEKRVLAITTKYNPGTTYHMLYVSCTEFHEYDGRLAKFALKLNEPNPADRT